MPHIARMRTLNAAYEMLKADDPHTCVSKNYIRTLIKTGAIPVHQVGCKQLFDYDALLAYLENPTEPTAAQQYGVIRPVK
ncbi:MAG: helix-turn-helix domain-containing protein [Firmicutes bacterium]|nr:helix-turn-helix domain-containing protein [Bacillota bacterium]